MPIDLRALCFPFLLVFRVKSEAPKVSGMPLCWAWHQPVGRRAARVTPGRFAGLGSVRSRGMLKSPVEANPLLLLKMPIDIYLVL